MVIRPPAGGVTIWARLPEMPKVTDYPSRAAEHERLARGREHGHGPRELVQGGAQHGIARLHDAHQSALPSVTRSQVIAFLEEAKDRVIQSVS